MHQSVFEIDVILLDWFLTFLDPARIQHSQYFIKDKA